MFEEITFPLGPRSLEGKWIICAQDWPTIFDVDKSEKYCIDFWVQESKQEASNKTELLINENAIEQEFEVHMDLEMATTFRPGVPLSGKVRLILHFLAHLLLPSWLVIP